MDESGKFWATLAAIIALLLCVVGVCSTIYAVMTFNTAVNNGLEQVQNNGQMGYHWAKKETK